MTLLSSQTIRLRALEPEDLEVLYRWENDTDLWVVGSTLAPFSKYLLKQYIAESHRDIYEMRQVRFIVEHLQTKAMIGLVDLFDFDPFHHRAAVGILIDKTHQRQGWATQALQLLEEYAFQFLKIHQLYVHVPVENEASIHLFRQCHYIEQGLFKDWIQTPAGYQDVIFFQKINSNKDL